MRYLFLLCLVKVSASYTLLFATSKDIRIANISKTKKIYTIIKDLNEAVAVDYLYNGSLVCYTDHGNEIIQCAPFNGSHAGAKITMAKTGISAPDGLACDWLTRKLYWTDSETNRLEVVSLDSRYRKVLFWQELDQPRGIAVDPLEGVMFWTDWGEMPKIERAAMNGDLATRKVIISENIFWPNSISLDIQSKNLYWIDGKYHFIEVTDYDGRNRKTLIEKGVSYPFALTLFGDKLYWSDWKTYSIHTADRKGGALPREVVHGDYVPMDVEVWDELRQPYKYTPCEKNNGGCSHLCLLSPYPPGYSCACPTGIRLISNVTCASEVEQFLLLVQRSEISKISLDSQDHTNMVLPLKGIKHAVGIDYDPVDNYFYWTDDETRNIRKAKLDGTGQEDLITTDISNPDGIAVDWAARNLYWSDTAARRIEVARLDGKYRRVLIFDDLGEPRAVAVSPEHGWLFWSDWYEKKPKIERADLDGTNRIILVKDDISWPNGIAIDVKRNKLFWGDAKVDKIEVINMDGSERKEILGDNLPHIFGLTLLGEQLYWTDWQRRTIDKINKYTGRDRQVILDQLPNVMGLKAVSIKEERYINPCSISNGGCEQLCFTKPDRNYICSCEIGSELNTDNKTCIIPEAFLIFFSDDHIRRISMQNSYANDVIPLTGIKSITAIDMDVQNRRVYWADNKLKNINRAYFNGSQAEKVIEFGLYTVESIAIDWLSNNIYWIDTGNVRIEVSSGPFRKVLFWNNLKGPRNLILDPREGYMYWSEWSKSGSIIKATMDGSSKQAIITRIGRVNGLTIDYAQRHLYWSQDDNGYSSIEMSDFDGKDHTQILFDINYKPFSITQYQDFIYWVNLSDGSVNEVNKFDGKNRKVLYSQYDRISDLKVVHSSKQTGWNSCVQNNGECNGLCLIRPGISFHSTTQNCTCPTHFIMKNNICIEPDNFILVAQRSALSRVVMDSNDCPHFSLAIPGLKSIRAIEYDPVTRFIYWIDGKAQAIKRSYENGTHIAIFVDGANEGRYNHFYDIVLDPFNRLLFWSCSSTDTINVTRLNNSTIGVIYKAIDGEKPRNLAVHPEKGLLFWADVGNRVRIVRSRLDGQKRVVVVSDLKSIEALTVDRTDNVIFFADSGKIYYCELDGRNKLILISSGVAYISSLTVMAGYVYWADKEHQQLERISKFNNDRKEIVIEQIPYVTDLMTVITPTVSTFHKQSCSEVNNHNYCSHLCIVSQDNISQAECSCPMGLMLNENQRECLVLPACGKDHFMCLSSGGDCIPNTWKCDGLTDCPDSSDETGCTECKHNQFRCHSGHCIDSGFICDGTHHCIDGSDEAKCCSEERIQLGTPYFQCTSNGDCIVSVAVCDGVAHCSDGSDETAKACESKNAKVDGYLEYSSNEILIIAFRITICSVVAVGIIAAIIIFLYKKYKKQYKPKRSYEDAALKPLTAIPQQRVDPIAHSINVQSSYSQGRNTGSNEPSNFTGVSSSGSMICYPLNPPPSPATTELCDDYCCPYSAPLHCQYSAPLRCQYSAPPPTPSITDICDESDCCCKRDS